MNHYFRIGQICRMYHISLDTLRYYDRIDLLKPALIKDNGYRYYREEQLDTLDLILTAKTLEIPLEKIKERIQEDEFASYLELLKEQRAVIQRQQKRLNQLSEYNEKIISTYETALTFQNDTVAYALRFEDIDLYIYSIAMENMSQVPEKYTENSRIDIQEWNMLQIDEKGILIPDSQTSFLFTDAQDRLKHENNDMVQIHHLTGQYGMIYFLGDYEAFEQYSNALIQHYGIRHGNIYLQYLISLTRTSKHNEYFIAFYIAADLLNMKKDI